MYELPCLFGGNLHSDAAFNFLPMMIGRDVWRINMVGTAQANLS
jgi:hypothetical protein